MRNSQVYFFSPVQEASYLDATETGGHHETNIKSLFIVLKLALKGSNLVQGKADCEKHISEMIIYP